MVLASITPPGGAPVSLAREKSKASTQKPQVEVLHDSLTKTSVVEISYPDSKERTPVNICLAIDVSGSMQVCHDDPVLCRLVMMIKLT